MPMHQRRLADGSAVSALCLGSMWLGSSVDEPTSFAILDRFTERGGTLIDTANSYAAWLEGCRGGESETVIGRWLASRGARDRVVLSTKVGAGRAEPGAPREGLAAAGIHSALDASLGRLGTDHVEVFWAHVEDRSVPLEETVDAFATTVESGKVGVLGASNHATWRVEQARQLSRAAGRPGYGCLQLRHSYLQPRAWPPLPHAGHLHAGEETFDYVRSHPELTLWTYSALLSGAYTRPDKPIHPVYEHPGTPPRLAALHKVADEAGATPNQVVLAWLLAQPQMIPIIGVSTVAQLDELLAAAELELAAEHLALLDDAGSCDMPG